MEGLGLPIECGSGGLTKYNRSIRNLPKTHWLDAACVGNTTPENLNVATVKPLQIAAKGWGNRRMCMTNAYVFPVKHRTHTKSFEGFGLGDIIRANIPQGKYTGVQIGRVTIRQRPSFRVNGIDVHPKYCRILQKIDGYAYSTGD